jgi:hypothetical protein
MAKFLQVTYRRLHNRIKAVLGFRHHAAAQDQPMTEIHFIVEDAPEGGYLARALGADIFTEADDLPSLYAQIRDALRCHFDCDQERPRVIRLHITREEVIAA